jgi:hypothetical protein
MNIFPAKQALLLARQLPSSALALPFHCHSRAKAKASMDFQRVNMASLRKTQAQLVCRTTGKLLKVYWLQTPNSLRMVRPILKTAAIRDTMTFGAIQDQLDA